MGTSGKQTVIAGFRRDVDEICALLGCYAASSGNPLPPMKQLHWASWPLKMGPVCFPETSVKDYQSTLCNNPEKRRSVPENRLECNI
jgi:hypothetical protein